MTPRSPKETALTNTTLNYNHLFYFHVVAQEGSIASAAKRLGVTQPTISEQLSKLEQSLGRKLFDRSSGRLRLNLAGRRAFEHTSVMFQTSSRLMQYFQNELDSGEIVLEIGIASSVSRSFAAEYFLPLFRRGDLRVRIRNGDYDYLLHSVTSRELDILLSDNCPANPESRRLKVTPIYRPNLLAVATGDLADQVESFPAGFGDVPIITYTQHSRYRWEIDQYLTRHGLHPRILAEVDDVNLMKVCAESGLCATILPEPLARPAIEEGALRELGQLADVDTTIYAHYHSEEIPQLVQEAVHTLTQMRPGQDLEEAVIEEAVIEGEGEQEPAPHPPPPVTRH